MTSEPTTNGLTLEYGQRPRRRRRRSIALVVGVLLIAVLGIAGWRYSVPIRTYLTEKYADWRFARAFDRTAGELTGDTGLWLAPAAFRPVTNSLVEQHLQTLLAASPNSVAVNRRPDDSNLVVFVRAGQTGKQQWIAFACINATGLEVFAFDRDARANATYHRLYETRQFWGLGSYKSGALKLEAVKVEASGPAVRTVVDINDGRNEIEWSVTASAPTPATGIRALRSTQLLTSTATPLTGWATSHDWWPATGGWRLIEGAPPAKEISAEQDARALAFVPDGRLAVVKPTKWMLVDVKSGAVSEHALPASRRPPEVFAFSPDGRTLFVGGTSEPAWLAQTTTGTVRGIGETAGMAWPTFPDNNTLVLLDNVKLRRVNCLSGLVEPAEMPGGGASRIAMAGARTAFCAQRGVQVIDAGGAMKRTFEQLQGTHQLSLSPDGRWLAIKGQSGLRLVDVDAGKTVWDHDVNYDLHTARSRITWSADGQVGAAAGDRWVYVWCLREPRWVARLPHERSGNSPDVALSSDGRQMAVSGAGSRNIGYWPNLEASVRPDGQQQLAPPP